MGHIKRGLALFFSFFDMKKHWPACVLVFIVLGVVSTAAQATEYNFSGSVGGSSYPTCSGGTWSSSSSTYTCTGSISLIAGDSIVGSKNITVVARAGINLAGNNTIGSTSKKVDLETTWGSISIAGTGNVIYGSLEVDSGSISVAGASVSGNVTTTSGSLTISDSTVSGTVTATSGAITLTRVALTGNIASGTGGVTLSGPSTVVGSIAIGGPLSITGGSVSGNVSAGNGVTMSGATVFGGNVTSTNGPVSLVGGRVAGSVAGHNGVTTTSGTVISGDVRASNGPISLSGGSVGSVYSDCCALTTNYTDIKGSINAKIGSARDSVSITGGTISGAISTSGGNGISITNATVPSGSITTTSVPIVINNSAIGTPSSPVNVTNNGKQFITVMGTSEVYGNVTTGGILTVTSPAVIYGDCSYQSISGQCKHYVPGPDHIQLELSGSPLTCAPSTVTVKACTSAAPGCTPLYTSAATAVTLSASNGAFWSSSPVTFTGSTTVALRKTTVGPTTLIATSSGSGATACYLNSSTNNCQIDFADSALLLSIPLQTAGVTSSGASLMTVSAVRASNNGKECVAAFGGQTRNVKFWSSYDDPSSGTKTLAVKGTSIPMNATSLAASTPSTGTAVALTFDATGTASVPLKYDDAGRLLLKARYDGSAANSDVNLVMTGSSLFVTAPHGLCVDSSDQNPDGTAAWLCAAEDPKDCSKYRKAGESFAFRVSGKAYQSGKNLCEMPTTANYRQSNIALSAKVVAPSDGDNGALGTQTIDITANGTATIDQQKHSEVGVFTFTATPPDSAYFGQTVAPGTSANFGRFIPDHFAISKASAISPACGGFSYFGQDGFTTSFTLTALSLVSGTTTNYRGDFARLDLSAWNAYGFATAAALPAGSALTASSTPPSGNWDKGVAAVSAKHLISRPSALAGETSVTLTARPLDSDGVTMASAAQVQSAATPLRYGRLKLANAFGSELLDLPLGLRLEYWAGPTQGWQMNTLDHCTAIKSSDFAFVFPVDAKNLLAACETKITIAGSAPSYTATLAAPGKGNAGWTDVRLNLGATASGSQCSVIGGAGPAAGTVAAPWLQFKWNSTVDTDPVARATFGFGVFNKAGPIINRRERY